MSAKKSIKRRLVGGLSLIVLFFLAQAALVWYVVDDVRNGVVDNIRRNTVALTDIGDLAILAQQARRYEKEYFVYVGNPEKREGYMREWRGAIEKINGLLGKMKTGLNGAFSPSEVAQITNWKVASDFYASEMEKIFVAVGTRATAIKTAEADAASAPPRPKAGGASAETVVVPAVYTPTEVNQMIQIGKEAFASGLIAGVAAMEKLKSDDSLALADQAGQSFNRLLLGVLVTVAVGTLIAVVLMATLPRTVTSTVDRLSASAEEMSMGRLDQAFDAGGIVEFDKLTDALNRMRLAQQALVDRLHGGRRHA